MGIVLFVGVFFVHGGGFVVFFCGFVWGFFCLFSGLFTAGRNQLSCMLEIFV